MELDNLVDLVVAGAGDAAQDREGRPDCGGPAPSARPRKPALVALYLTGTLPQGRIGVGWRTLESAAGGGTALGSAPRSSGGRSGPRRGGGGEGAGVGDPSPRAPSRAAPADRRRRARVPLPAPPGGGAPGGPRRPGARRHRPGGGAPAGRGAPRPRCSPTTSESWRGPRSPGARRGSRASRSGCSPRWPPCSPARPTTSRRRSPGWVRRPSSTRSTARASRCTGPGDEVRVFTRQLQDVTARVPEVVELARRLPVPACVLEGEALALRADGRPQPFQVTMRRFGRSKDVAEARRACR